ncbi:MAG: peptide MFS transporter [Gemmatimonadales bacterium]
MPRNHDTAFFGHPSGLSTLFFTEMWERFSYYGSRAILILFMTAPAAIGGLGWNADVAGPVYGTYTSAVYLMSLPGGWIADKILGLRRSVFWGGVLIMLGQVCLAIPHTTAFFFPGLVLIALGTGLLKPNISALVGQLYREGDVRRDAGFSIYYMGINLGAFLAPLIVGWLAQGEGFQNILRNAGFDPAQSWHYGFAFGALGMAFGLIQYVLTGHRMGEAGQAVLGAPTPESAADARRKFWLATGVVVALIAVLVLLARAGTITLSGQGVSRVLDYALVVVTVVFFAWLFLAGEWTPDERRRLVVIVVLFLGASVFWSAFEQAGSSLNLFAERETRTSVLGMSFPASWFQSVNAVLIVLLAPVAAWLWVKLGKHDPSSPAKFAFGLFFVAAGFAVMVIGAQRAQAGVLVSPMWLLVTYLLHTIGELCLSPVGLSAMTKLAPARVTGLMMGVWFLAASVGNKIAGTVAGLYETMTRPTIFGSVALFALFWTLVFLLLIRPIKRMLAR